MILPTLVRHSPAWQLYLHGVKFGKLDAPLESMDWTLPASAPGFTMADARSSDNDPSPEVRVGGTMWTIRPWRGKVYPAQDPQRTWPAHYGRQFGTLEFNATHYRIHPADRMAKWASAMPEGFRFCPKFPQIITHFRRFKGCESPTDDFIEGLLALGANLGPSFIQLPPHFAPHHAEAMRGYLAKWPRELKVAVEFRHPGWFEGGTEAEETWALMRDLGMGAVISDTAGRRDALHMRVTAPFVLVRFGGYEGHASDEARLEAWAQRIAMWRDDGLKEFHLLVHQPDSVHTPETCRQFARLVDDRTGLKVQAPVDADVGLDGTSTHGGH